MAERGAVRFTAPAGGWGRFVSLREVVPFDRPVPLALAVAETTPPTFFRNGGNVALTTAMVEGRLTIVATNLSDAQLARLDVVWWRFQE